VICIDARRAKAARSMQINKSDRNDAVDLARMGTVPSVAPQAPPEKSPYDLSESLSVHRALIKDQRAARTATSRQEHVLY